MLVVMIEGNLFAVKIPPHYKFVPSLSIVMQAEMAILNGKVIKSSFAHEKHEEVLALLLVVMMKTNNLILLLERGKLQAVVIFMTLEIYIHFIQMEQFPLTLREKPMSIIIILILIIPFWLLTMKMVMAMKKCI